MINYETILKKLNYVLTHNKTLSKTNYFLIDEVKEEIEKDYINQLKKEYTAGRFLPLAGVETFKIFDDLQNLSNDDFKKLYNKAKKIYYEFTQENNFKNENAFISSSSLNGFYFPNLQSVRVIAFINKKPILLY